MRTRLPLNGLRAFEAAARHKSFAQAADELGVTPAAVSQQVQKLEAIVGTDLLIRTTRSVERTQQAEDVLSLISDGFEMLDLAMKEMMSVRQRNFVTISATPSFSSCWLLPRLENLRDDHPDITVHVDARNEHVDFQRDGVDLAIRHGTGKYSGLNSELLFEDKALVVANPEFLKRQGDASKPEDLKKIPLIHVDWKMHARFAPTWLSWSKFHDVDDMQLQTGMRFSMEDHAVKAAIAGVGVALVTYAFVQDDLKSGRLVRVLPERFDMPTAFHHFLVAPKGNLARRSVQKLCDWLRNQAKT